MPTVHICHVQHNSNISYFVTHHLFLYKEEKSRAPVCRDGCHEHSLGTVGRAHNTRLALARPPRRSAEPQLQSGYNQLREESGKNKQTWSLLWVSWSKSVSVCILKLNHWNTKNETKSKMTIFALSRCEYLSVTDGLGLGEIWARVTGFINEDTDGVWDAGVQTVNDVLQLLL